MEKNTELAKQPESALGKFRNLLSQEVIKSKFQEALGKKAPLFMSNLTTIMSGSTELQKCEHMSVISSALMAASMDLPLTPGLGFAGIVPYWDTPSGTMKAQFQVMKKGYIQLAQRTGLFKIIHVSEVFEGELKSHNKFTGEFVFDEGGRKSDNVVGYVSYFRLINGFEKYFYMPIEKLDRHAKKYSKSFQKGKGKWADKEEGGYEQMCEKTVLKLNLATYAPLSVDINMMNAIVYDQAEIRDMDAKDYDYVDNEDSHRAEEKEVLQIPDGRQVIIDKKQEEKTARMTGSAVDKIPENRFAPVDAEIIPPAPQTTLNDVMDAMKTDKPEEPPFRAERGSVEYLDGKITKVDGQPVEEQPGGPGHYSMKQLGEFATKDLLAIVNADTDMIEASEMIGGKNTSKKLREIIFAHQEGKLAQYVAPFLKQETGQKPEITEQNAGAGIAPNKDFDKQKSDKEIDDFLHAPSKTTATGGNKYNMEIPIFDKNQEREFSTLKKLYNQLASLTPPLNNPRYLEVGAKMGILDKYQDREAFCRYATISEINALLNEN